MWGVETVTDNWVSPNGLGRRLRPVKSLVRAIDLLDALAEAGKPLGVTDLATVTGFSKTATYNLITTLEMRGLIRRDGGNRYGLGWRLLELGEYVRTRSSLGEVARPHVVNLADMAGETAFVGILDGESILCLEMAESRRSVPMDFAPGRRAPIEDNAAGEVLLAFASPRRRRRYAQGRPRGAEDGEVIAQLDAVRRDGYAVSREDPESIWASLAVPFRDLSGEVVGALALIGPKTRLTDGRMRELTPSLDAEGGEVSRSLGFR